MLSFSIFQFHQFRTLICALGFCSLFASCATQPVGPQTIINDEAAAQRLKGDRDLSLQWISWDDFGKATVTDERGLWKISGRQDSQTDDDFLAIDGVITEINRFDFNFEGSIITQVSYINGGEPVIRTGPMTFRITGTRKYWRLMQMNNPADSCVDYVDIYFRKHR